MKIFISWSGERSRAIAEILRRWLPSVLQAVRPYFTPDDIAKGARWNSEISKELEASRIGLLILTPENQNAPWLVFEAGALAKNLDRSKVCPILFGGLEATDVKGPLVQFQAARFDSDDMKRVVKMMNTELGGEAGLSPDVLESVFEMWWPRLEEQVNEEFEKHETDDDKTTRSERDILQEVLALTRTMASERSRRMEEPIFEDLVSGVIELLRLLAGRPLDDEIMKAARRLLRPLEFMVRRGGPRMLHSPRLRHSIMEIEELFLREVGKAETSGEPTS